MKHRAHLTTALLLTALAGCVTTTYVCQDGSTVDAPGKCTTVAQPGEKTQVGGCEGFRDASGAPDVRSTQLCELKKNPTAAYCAKLSRERLSGGLDLASCTTELAALMNDTSFCASLDGNAKTLCEAIAVGDLSSCDSLASQSLREECERRVVERAKPRVNLTSCLEKDGEQRIWCITYAADDAGDCLLIDDLQHPDEAAFCRARVSGNASVCSVISDDVLSGLCVRIVAGV